MFGKFYANTTREGTNSWKPSFKKRPSTAQDPVTALLHQQYNSPLNMYSMTNIAETLTANAEMIAPGVMGINFMKPEHPVNTRSEVYKLVQEEEQNKAKSPTPPKATPSPSVMMPRRAAQPVKTPPPVMPKPAASVLPPVEESVPQQPMIPGLRKTPAPPPSNAHGTCSDCGRYITTAYARVGEKILHDECFRCSTCGTSLQNTGYSSLNNKLYCEVHAKLAAKLIAQEMVPSMPPSLPSDILSPSPIGPPSFQNTIPPLPVSSQAPPPLMQPIDIPAPTAYVPPTQPQPLPAVSNIQHSASSSGFPFRSVSPKPFKRISGDFHKVTAPTSPTPSSEKQSFFQESSGPLPFESKPYMPPGQSLYQTASSSQMSSTTTQISSFQQTSLTQQSSQYQMDYKQTIGAKGTKFVWPPPKPEELLSEKKIETTSTANLTAQQTYSPLATQSSPPESHIPSTCLPTSVPEVPASTPKPYVPPPLPSTFPRQEPESQPQASEPKTESASAPVSAAPAAPTSSVPGFAPVLPPVVDTESKKDGGVPQAGVPIGAGSRPAPRRGKGQLKEQIPGCRIPICSDCGTPIRGPFVIALGKTWCPEHFICNNLHCKRQLEDIGFVEEQGQLYCENCYEAFLAPICNKCNVRIKGDCLNALDKSWHPECFLCAYCHKPFGNSSFYLEDALPYCEKDWNELFTTKCVGCGFPIEAGDRWVEALNNNYHSQCFKCSICSKNLEGQSFFAKGGKPFCKAHAR